MAEGNEKDIKPVDVSEVIDTEQLKKLPPDKQQAALQVIMNQVSGLDNAPQLTEAQTDELLSQRRLILDYTRQDHIDSKNIRTESTGTIRLFWISGLVAFIVIFLAVLFVRPDLLPQLISLVVGGGGGYGIGKATGNKNQGE